MRARIFLILLGCAATAASQHSVADSQHNLSATGPGAVRARSEDEICIFCHTTHSAAPQAPLWNRRDSGQVFRMYWSETIDAYASRGSAPQPSGSSKLCMSCHDGTIALGSTVASGTIAMAGDGQLMPARSRLPSDLSGHHPVSFELSDSLVAQNNSKGDVPLRSPREIAAEGLVPLDGLGRMQCTTCHDPHQNPYGDFLRVAAEDRLCVSCHS